MRRLRAERFAQGDENPVLAHDLRVSGPIGSVPAQGPAVERVRALAVKGPASLPLFSDELFAVLEREPAKGPVTHGPAGPDLDPGADQDADRVPLPQGAAPSGTRRRWPAG